MTDTEIVDYIANALQVGARICYNEDDDYEEDDWGKIPIGFSIRFRACSDSNVSASSLRECIERDAELAKSSEVDLL